MRLVAYAVSMRAAIYVRLSKDSDASTSPARQRAACEQFCQARGWEVALIAEDVDVSATKRRLARPGLDQVRAAYREIDAVVYWKTDRLARSLLDYAELMAEADAAGVALVSATEPLDTSTDIGRAMAQIVAIFAEMEARSMGARQRSTIEHLRTIGRTPGGRLPFWLIRVPNPAGPGFVEALSPVYAPLMREAAERVLAGESLPEIALSFTERGVPTPDGKARWNPTTIRARLRHPSIAGRIQLRGAVMRDSDGVPLAHRPAILTSEEFAEVNRALASRARGKADTRRPSDLLLSGLAVCSLCGYPLYRKASSNGGNYACYSRNRGTACRGVAVSIRNLDALVTEEFLTTYGAFQEVRETLPAGDAPTAELDAVREALDDLERDRYERGLFAGEAGAARFAEMHARLSARLTGLLAQVPPSEPTQTPTGRTLAEAWEASGTRQRREILGGAVTAVIVSKHGGGPRVGLNPERVRIVWG